MSKRKRAATREHFEERIREMNEVEAGELIIAQEVDHICRTLGRYKRETRHAIYLRVAEWMEHNR